MRDVILTQERAIEAARAAAKDNQIHVLVKTAEGKYVSHTRTMDEALFDLGRAELIAFTDGLFNHDIVALIGGLLYYYDVRHPLTPPLPGTGR